MVRKHCETHLNLEKLSQLNLSLKNEKSKRKLQVENQLRGVRVMQELLWRSGQQPRAGICRCTQRWSRPSSWLHPHTHLSCSLALLSSKTPESLINYKHVSRPSAGARSQCWQLSPFPWCP